MKTTLCIHHVICMDDVNDHAFGWQGAIDGFRSLLWVNGSSDFKNTVPAKNINVSGNTMPSPSCWSDIRIWVTFSTMSFAVFLWVLLVLFFAFFYDFGTRNSFSVFYSMAFLAVTCESIWCVSVFREIFQNFNFNAFRTSLLALLFQQILFLLACFHLATPNKKPLERADCIVAKLSSSLFKWLVNNGNTSTIAMQFAA